MTERAELLRLKAALESQPTVAERWTGYVQALLACGEEAAAQSVVATAARLGLPVASCAALVSMVNQANDRDGATAESGWQALLGEMHDKGELPTLERLANALLLNEDQRTYAWEALGAACEAQGKLDVAEMACRNAIARDPGSRMGLVNLPGILLAQQRFDEALAAAERAVERLPEVVAAHVNLGNAYAGVGRAEDALRCYERATEIAPNLAAAHYNMGRILLDLHRHAESADCLERALRLDPDYRDACLCLGTVHTLQKRPAEADLYFRRALQIDPQSAEAWVGLSSSLIDAGQFERARELLDRALANDSDQAVAWARLASLRKMTHQDTAWLEKAKQLVARPQTPHKRFSLYYAIGKFHDDLGECAAAFAAYSEANRIKRTTQPHYDRGNEKGVTDALIAYHPVERVRCIHSGANDSLLPLFIVGMPRSGTSLLEQILASHPKIHGAGEREFWLNEMSTHKTLYLQGRYPAERLQAASMRCLAELRGIDGTAARVVDKMPDNFRVLGLIHATFPNARILHAQRNPVDTCLSIHFQNFSAAHAYATNLDDLAHYYRQYHRLMAHWRSVLPKEVFLDIPYESLIEDQEGWSRKIIEFMGLEWDERCLDFYKTERKVGTASNWQARQPIYKTSKERWRNYEKYVGPLLPLLDLYDPAKGQA